ncbi:MAG: hypothetical protein F6K39_37250, partial [Okeania sp. SIO3B3]|nr:hypothetical protein [Okeania sp. SIO3B3]
MWKIRKIKKEVGTIISTRILRLLILLLLGLLLLCLPSCRKSEPGLGTVENPIVWTFIPSNDQSRITQGINSLTSILYDETGLYFVTRISSNYREIIK